VLRLELAQRARIYAAARAAPYSESYGEPSVVCFRTFGDSAHGNFLAASYKAICGNPEWRRRLQKVHTSARRSLPAMEQGRWRELDSCMSSDALLMNVFCYPRVLANTELRRALEVEAGGAVQFGFPARVPLKNGRFDRTEVDLRLGDLLLEAKLTEVDFQRTPKVRLHAYRDFDKVFDVEGLPQSKQHFDSYQIIRNVLAAHAGGRSFCVLLDARRPDLMERYYAVLSCVLPVELRTVCRVLTWQELAQTLQGKLRAFLSVKYGIE
jgi:hypothetical protein